MPRAIFVGLPVLYLSAAPLEEFVASEPLADYGEALGGGFLMADQFLAIAYESLSQ